MANSEKTLGARLEDAKSKKTFAARLAEAMASMPNPRKDTKAYNYKYETLDQVLSIVQPALMEQGLFVQQGVVRRDAGEWALTTTIIDTSDGNAQLMDMRPLLFGEDQQRNGSYETYARRYALKTVFGLCGEDDDGAATTPSKGRKAPQKAPDGLTAAKQRAWAAMKAWGELNGRTGEQVLEGVKKRPDYAETEEFFNGIADEFEGAVS